MRVYKILSFSEVILLITVVFAGAVTVPAAAQSDTMQFRYNAQHTGDYSPVAGSTMSIGKLMWNYTTADIVFSSPAISNGVVYVGSYDSNVYALNATTGATVWNYATGSSVYSSPTVANGTVYVGSDDNNVYALNATTGAKLWNYTTGGGVDSSPAVVNGVVYVGSDDNNVYAIGNATAATSQATTPGNSTAATSQATTHGFEVVLVFVGFIFVGLVIAALAVRRKS